MLIRENMTFDQAGIITETKTDDNGNKTLYMQGKFIVGDVKNLNQRVYPKSEINSAVTQINKLIENGETIFGECDHPAELTINLDRVSHFIEKMWMEGNIGMGRLKVVPTPHGQIIRTLIENGAKIGISSRGSGEVGYNGTVSGFEIITCDLVARPSGRSSDGEGCYPSPIFEVYNSKRSSIITDLAEAVRYDSAAQSYLTNELKHFIAKLK